MEYQSGKKLSSPTIAVDVTPILPGGENGGAKVFALELIRVLARINPNAKFVLLTHAASHDELAILECKNVRRLMVIGKPGSADSSTHVRRLYWNKVPRLPDFIRRRLTQSAYKINGVLKRAGKQRILQQIGADLLFCPFTAPTFFDRRVPTVCTVYDLQFAAYPQFFEPEDVIYRKNTFKDACRKANMLVAISNYSRKSAIAYSNLSQNRIKTIYLQMAKRITPVPPEFDANDILNKLGLSRQRYLIYPANFWKHKNHEMLLTAFATACVQGLPQDMKMVCSGASTARKKFIQSAATAFCISHRMVLPGYLSDAEFSILLNNANGLVFPSLYEGFGLPVIEAMAVGVPVACSSVTSLPEIAGSGAVFFDPKKPMDIAHALIKLVNDKPLRHKLVKDGYCQAEKFSDTERMAIEYWKVFESVLCGRPR